MKVYQHHLNNILRTMAYYGFDLPEVVSVKTLSSEAVVMKVDSKYPSTWSLLAEYEHEMKKTAKAMAELAVPLLVRFVDDNWNPNGNYCLMPGIAVLEALSHRKRMRIVENSNPCKGNDIIVMKCGNSFLHEADLLEELEASQIEKAKQLAERKNYIVPSLLELHGGFAK